MNELAKSENEKEKDLNASADRHTTNLTFMRGNHHLSGSTRIYYILYIYHFSFIFLVLSISQLHIEQFAQNDRKHTFYLWLFISLSLSLPLVGMLNFLKFMIDISVLDKIGIIIIRKVLFRTQKMKKSRVSH